MRDQRGQIESGLFWVGAVLVLVLVAMWGWPRWNVYRETLNGQAALRHAEFTRQIRVVEAQAVEHAATSLAQAEINRARGVAQANRIIGESLKGNEAYLRWLWIEGLKESQEHATVIYIPTEAGIPILEAGKRP